MRFDQGFTVVDNFSAKSVWFVCVFWKAFDVGILVQLGTMAAHKAAASFKPHEHTQGCV